jgi:hypothetical protein
LPQTLLPILNIFQQKINYQKIELAKSLMSFTLCHSLGGFVPQCLLHSTGAARRQTSQHISHRGAHEADEDRMNQRIAVKVPGDN